MLRATINAMKIFHSKTFGDVSLEKVGACIMNYITQSSDTYHVIIGSDSQQKSNGTTDFVTAIILHHVGYGGIYFWYRAVDRKKRVLKQRIFEEATMSLETAHELMGILKEKGVERVECAIHVDIGNVGPTRELINEVTAMIRGSGFTVQTKPYSYGASKVADRHT